MHAVCLVLIPLSPNPATTDMVDKRTSEVLFRRGVIEHDLITGSNGADGLEDNQVSVAFLVVFLLVFPGWGWEHYANVWLEAARMGEGRERGDASAKQQGVLAT